jgi:DNA-binding transcriptional LysR family regulator
MGPVNRPLDLEWLEDFLALTETGNFSRAAQARSIAQPAFSRHIRALEEWAGVELVDRSQHPASPTAAGAVINDVARDVVLRLAQARARAQEAQEQASRSLRFAATHVLSLSFFPGWLQRLEQHLRLQLGPIHMVSDSFQSCEELMLRRRVQFLLCYGHAAVPTRLLAPDFEFLRVSVDRLLPVAAPDAAGAPLHRLGTEAVVPVLTYSEESGLGQIMRAQLAEVQNPVRFKPVITSHHAVLLKTMALEGRGIAWLPQSLVAAELADGRLVVVLPEDQNTWQLPLDIRLFRATAGQTPLTEALWAQIEAAGNES